MQEIIKRHIFEHQEVLNSIDLLAPAIEKIALLMIDALKNGKAIFWCGNGGSGSGQSKGGGMII